MISLISLSVKGNEDKNEKTLILWERLPFGFNLNS